ncbi:MAG: sugar phosphate isomerase/epimerase, partial [Thermoguttaceae bacterium]|nr:sugar phosphate isomerase/epimerase [Thermoguttaceae bacterium]
FLFWHLIEGLSQTLDYAAEKGVSVAFEPEPGMFISNMQEFQTLLEYLDGDKRLKLTIDVGHLVCNGEPVRETILQWKDRLVNIHLEDMKRREHKHLPFGQGDVNVNEALAALREANYNYGVYVELSRESPQEGKRGWVSLSTSEEKAAFEDEARELAESAQALKIV